MGCYQQPEWVGFVLAPSLLEMLALVLWREREREREREKKVFVASLQKPTLLRSKNFDLN